MNKLFLTLALASVAIAAPLTTCPPSFTTDGIEVTPGCPGLTYQIVIEPSSFLVAFNDNPIGEGLLNNNATGDGDVNDIWVTGLIIPTHVAGIDAVFVKYGGALASWANEIAIGSDIVDAAVPGPSFAGLFAVGSTLPIQGLAGDGVTYFGDASQNPDGATYFYETQTPFCATPEPEAIWMLVGGLALIMCAKSRQNRKA